MFRKICFAAMTAVAAVSCCEKDVVLSEHEAEGELVTFSVSVPGLETKSTGDSDEKNVNSLQVIVFNKHGIYESSAYGRGTALSLTCTAGQKRMVALVNTNMEEGMADFDELAARSISLKDMGIGDLVMLGDSTLTVAANRPINLDVAYLSSKIVLESVTLNMSNQQHRNLPFAIKSVFLTNVAGDRQYIAESDPTTWYHQDNYDKQNTLPFLYDSLAEGHDMTNGDTYSTAHYFYCYPNQTTTKTRLVIEAEIGGQIYYYPIILNQLLPNNQYSYNVVLTRLGAESPDADLDRSAYTVRISMKDWKSNSSVVEI
jgi:hypothetical protein